MYVMPCSVKAKRSRWSNCHYRPPLKGNGKVVYEALSDGEIDVKRLREVVVQTLLAFMPQDEAIWRAVDATPIRRPDAQTSEDRGYIHLSNLPLVDKPRKSRLAVLPCGPLAPDPK